MKKAGPKARRKGEGQSVPASSAVPSVPVAAAAAAAATAAVPAEGPELELPLSAAAALPSLAAVANASVARLALVLDRADVERRVDVLNQLLRLPCSHFCRHKPPSRKGRKNRHQANSDDVG